MAVEAVEVLGRRVLLQMFPSSSLAPQVALQAALQVAPFSSSSEASRREAAAAAVSWQPHQIGRAALTPPPPPAPPPLQPPPPPPLTLLMPPLPRLHPAHRRRRRRHHRHRFRRRQRWHSKKHERRSGSLLPSSAWTEPAVRVDDGGLRASIGVSGPEEIPTPPSDSLRRPHRRVRLSAGLLSSPRELRRPADELASAPSPPPPPPSAAADGMEAQRDRSGSALDLGPAEAVSVDNAGASKLCDPRETLSRPLRRLLAGLPFVTGAVLADRRVA